MILPSLLCRTMPAPLLPPKATRASRGGGGFIHDPIHDALDASAPSSSSSHPHRGSYQESLEPHRLSPAQLTRLRSHLDATLLDIQRRWAKRYYNRQTSPNDQVPSRSSSAAAGPPLTSPAAYLAAWQDEVIPILARIDPVGAVQTGMAIQYAFAMTDSIGQGLMGYAWPIDPPPSSQEQGQGHDQAGSSATASQQLGPQETLQIFLTVMSLLDGLWASLLLGRRFDLTPSDETTDDGSDQRRRPLHHTRPLLGSLTTKTLSLTDKIRLRNLLVTKRGELSNWVTGQATGTNGEFSREELEEMMKMDFKPTDQSRAAEARRKRKRDEQLPTDDEAAEEAGAADRKLPKQEDGQDGGDDDDDLEEVVVPSADLNGNGIKQEEQQPDAQEEGVEYETTDEHRRYTALFDRKLADESDEDEEDNDQEESQDRGSRLEDEDEDQSPAPEPATSSSRSTHAPHIDPMEAQLMVSKIFSKTLSLLERMLEEAD